MGGVDGPSIVLVTMAAAAVLSNTGAYGPLRLQIAMSTLILSCIALSGDQAEVEVAAATWSAGAQPNEGGLVCGQTPPRKCCWCGEPTDERPPESIGCCEHCGRPTCCYECREQHEERCPVE